MQLDKYNFLFIPKSIMNLVAFSYKIWVFVFKLPRYSYQIDAGFTVPSATKSRHRIVFFFLPETLIFFTWPHQEKCENFINSPISFYWPRSFSIERELLRCPIKSLFWIKDTHNLRQTSWDISWMANTHVFCRYRCQARWKWSKIKHVRCIK